MNKSDEDKLIQSVSFAATRVQQGDEPEDALFKAAREYSLQPGELRVVCNAFNTGRQNVQWGQRGDILDKLASTPLADYSVVFQRLWGRDDAVKVAFSRSTTVQLQTYGQQRIDLIVNGDYFPPAAPTTVEKVANVHDERTAKFRNLHLLRQRVDRQRTEKSAAESRFNLHLHQLYSYFRKSATLRDSFSSVKAAAVAYRGNYCESLFNHIEDRVPAKFLRGGNQKVAVDWSAEPFCYVDRLIEQAQTLAAAQECYEKLAAEYSELFNDAHEIPAEQSAAEKLAAESPLDAEIELPEVQQKQSGVLTGMASAGTFGATKGLVDSLSADESAKLEKYVSQLESPGHVDRLRSIRAQTLLAEMMSDPENPISAYDPSDVADAYNNIVQLSPRLADQPSVISSLLQKRLLGKTEPFELGETLKLESGLKQTQDATPSLELKGGGPWT